MKSFLTLLFVFFGVVACGLVGMLAPFVVKTGLSLATHFLAGAMGALTLLTYLVLGATHSIETEERERKAEWKRNTTR